MTERIIDIIMLLMSQLKINNDGNSSAGKQIQDINFSEVLDKKDFTEKEISTAVSWMKDKLWSDKPNEINSLQFSNQNVYRFISADEKELFTEDALELLMRLQALNLISNEHIDIMLEKANFLGFRQINSDMIKQYIAIFLFEAPDLGYTGSRTLLNYFDKIN